MLLQYLTCKLLPLTVVLHVNPSLQDRKYTRAWSVGMIHVYRRTCTCTGYVTWLGDPISVRYVDRRIKYQQHSEHTNIYTLAMQGSPVTSAVRVLKVKHANMFRVDLNKICNCIDCVKRSRLWHFQYNQYCEGFNFHTTHCHVDWYRLSVCSVFSSLLGLYFFHFLYLVCFQHYLFFQ